MVRGGKIVKALTICQQGSSSKASASSAWFEEKSSRHLRPVNRQVAARHQYNQHGMQRKGIRIITWFGEEKSSRHLLSVNMQAAARNQDHQHGKQQQRIRIISMGRGGIIVEALTLCQQAGGSKASGSSAWVEEGKQQQGIRIISMVRGGEIFEALTVCHQASSSKASGSSAWFEEEKYSRHLQSVNRQAAATHQDHQHGSRRRNRRGTHRLSPGKQQQGISIVQTVFELRKP
ncbi:hypothetical protein EDB19DRAFT_1971545 [Suillus lakei]|nr:hypothetical protein EDB19DRAFT_1971545 [Suillus lakei]